MSFRTYDTSSHLFFLTLLQQEASAAPSLVLCQCSDSATLCLCSACALPNPFCIFFLASLLLHFVAMWTGLSDFSQGIYPFLLNLLTETP